MSSFSYFCMPAITLLEGCLYLGLSIWGLVMRACSQVTTDIFHKPFQFTIDLLYLQDEECGNPNVTIFGVSESAALELNWDQAESFKKRTFVLLIHYIIYSVLWIIFSLLLIFSITKSPKRWILFFWFKFIWALSIIDVIATCFYAYDIVHTSSAVKTFDYLGLTANEATLLYLTSFDAQFTTPAIVMTVISSRGGILWLFNVIGSLYYFLIMRKIIPKKTLPIRIISTTDNVIPVTIVIHKVPPSEVFI